MSHRLVIETTETTTKRTVVYIDSPPSPGHATKVSFTKSKRGTMLGTITLSLARPTEHITSRAVTVTLNGTDLPVQEAITIPATFTANDGDTYSISVVDTNSVGSAPPGPPLAGVAALPLTVPTPGFATAVVFSDVAPTPVPNP